MYTYRTSGIKGQSLTEYIMVGTLILLVIVPVMLLMGGQVKIAMADIVPNWRSPVMAQAQVELPVTPSSPDKQITSTPSGYLPKVQLSAAQQIALGKRLTDKIQTLGANGTTTLMANQLSLLAQQLLAEGKIDQTQYASIMDLSNQGHRMAMIEGKLEKAMIEAGGDANRLHSSTILLDGQTYSVGALSGTLGYVDVGPVTMATQDLLKPNVPTSAELTRFLSLYSKVEKLGLLKDPAVKATIDSASYQITGLAETMEHAVYIYSFEGKNIQDDNNLRQYLASNATHFESSRICIAGDFKDNGVLCSK